MEISRFFAKNRNWHATGKLCFCNAFTFMINDTDVDASE